MTRFSRSLLLLLAASCGDSSTDEPKVTLPSHLAISADWLNQSISYVDMDALRAPDATYARVVTSRVSLAEYSPGPLELELTPDKQTALVSVSAGFFAIPLAGGIVNASTIPDGPGKLLFIDVATQNVEAALDTGSGPMGIAITPDGSRAFVAHFTSGDIAIVDVPNRKILSNVPIGAYAEEISLDDTGTVGVVGYSTAGSVRTFAASDLAGTLSPSVDLEGDSAGVAFFPGTKIALVMQAANGILSNSSGYTLLDVRDPSAPRVLEDVRKNDGVIGYPAVPAASRGTVLAPVTDAGRLILREYELKSDKVNLRQSIDVGPGNLLAALGVGFDGDHHAVMMLPATRSVAITDLDTGETQIVPWQQTNAGPADIVFVN